jgi:hypothetical protein
MKIDESNTIYVFKDNEKMDCPENLITHVCLDDISDLNNWFEDNLKSIKDKYFIQFLFENGSFIRTHSAKMGFVKYIRIWQFMSASEFRGEIVLDYFYGNMRGLGNKSIPIEDFTEILQNENENENEKFSAKFRLHGCSKHSDFPKEPNIIFDARKDQNKKLKNELNSRVPDFDLSHLGLKLYELGVNTFAEEFYHLISTKQALLIYLEELFINDSLIKRLSHPAINIEFRNSNNQEQQGEVVYFMVDSIDDYDGFLAECSLSLHLTQFEITSKKEVKSLEELVEAIFAIPDCNSKNFPVDYQITDITKKAKINKRSSTKSIPFTEGELQKLVDVIDFSESKIIKFEGEDNWLELAPASESDYCINFSYPSTEEPYSLFKKLNIDIPVDFNLNFWEANSACMFVFEVKDKIKLQTALFVSKILSDFLQVKYNELDITVEDF